MNFEEKLKELEKICNELVDKIDQLKKEKQEAEKPKNRFWKPEVNETYYSITYEGNIHKFFVSPHHSISNSILNANCYRESEKELAEKDAKRMQARQIIQRVADQLHGYRYEFKEGEFNNCVCYMSGLITAGRSTTVNEGNIYFESLKIAQKCLELCEAEYKILLGVE